jgi:Zn-dependent peptidase ImmA (M78 family)/DNA-binding transcriptional regulator YiaG
MAAKVSGINAKVLVWARERSGRSVAQVAQEMKRAPEEIAAWESSASAPTYAQLEDLAYRVYKRPLALFFFPEPPDEPDPKQSFRTLPETEVSDLAADTRFKVRQARAYQLGLYELHAGKNPAPRKIFRDLSAPTSANALEMAGRVREYLGVTLETQRAWGHADDALKEWRERVEEHGVYIFKNTFKQKDVSGFCLHDSEFPIIYINNSTAKVRQIFTLAHELAHLLVGTSGVTKRDQNYIAGLTGEPRRVEMFCNRFAGECLLPVDEVKRVVHSTDDELVSAVAKEYSVSRPVVLTRMLELGMVSQEQYEQRVSGWKTDYDATKGKNDSGGNYYATQASYFGDRFLKLAFGRYYEGKISQEQLADHLNVPVKNLEGFEHSVLDAPHD